MRKYTKEEIEGLKSKRGGWTKDALAQLGVPWPPPTGWRKALMNGEPMPIRESRKLITMAEHVSKYETGGGQGQRTITCTASTCSYPACACRD